METGNRRDKILQCSDFRSEVRFIKASVQDGKCEGEVCLLEKGYEGETILINCKETDNENQDSMHDTSCFPLSVKSEKNTISVDFFKFQNVLETGIHDKHVYSENHICGGKIVAATPLHNSNSNSKTEIGSDSFEVEVSNKNGHGSGTHNLPSPTAIFQSNPQIVLDTHSGITFSSMECKPCLGWGLLSIRGGRTEMEDAVTAVPNFMKIPINILGNEVQVHDSPARYYQSAHFFAVYDGHGGSQVANYCRDRLHSMLMEEIEIIIQELNVEGCYSECQAQWQRVFTSCFIKVDSDIGGGNGIEAVAPETVGSTAIVAIICSSHIIVANCGDSRAVLCRGKEPFVLSIDHRPDRKDEYERIEGAGGKVIQWNGYRVFGVLAMSRSIGDKYLKPWIIPDPEVRMVGRRRDDELLIIASDGLWDVMTNEEACRLARRCILSWRRKNPDLITEDAAPQAAADFLCNRAIQKGSSDNISIIVLDLKPTHSKLKPKPSS